VHFKDIDAAGNWRVMGGGITDFAEIIRILRSGGYGGYVMIEDESGEAETDPDAVALQNAEYIKKYPGRYPVFHVKDMPADVKCGEGLTDFSTLTDKDFAPVGSGVIDFAGIFKLNGIAGAKHFIVENDKPADPKECVELSGKYLRELKF
jgi:sugar phosphate isomerase/epimerase